MLPTPYSRRQQPDIDVRSELFEALPAMEAEPGIRSRMKDIFDRCDLNQASEATEFQGLFTRQCLGHQHDKLITPIRDAVWDAIEIGS